MNTTTRMGAWASGHAERRAGQWAARSEKLSTRLAGWRTRARTRLLIRIYVTALTVGLTTTVVQIFWTPFLLVWAPFTAIIVVSWTMLRTVINIRDVAPDSELDEYESTVLRTWQVAAYGWMTLLLLALSIFMIVVAVNNPDSLDRWVYTAGLFSILGMMSTTAVPTIAYATTFGPVPVPPHTD